ncbi:hypothetical protein SAMN05877809_10880 [Rhodobacter sp. JA431]|uniref:hypothetical protein n=1 Tax=Rhodobacter sp. JA431 TaxID=570013 RepID=UPI000BDB81F3|nr:hypothetical protein [Rhodobacter sp. JA431]SOC15921.1 hypothetical protein SAMN05877809_10880 [Rhodobacter sp. JA431]
MSRNPITAKISETATAQVQRELAFAKLHSPFDLLLKVRAAILQRCAEQHGRTLAVLEKALEGGAA